MSKRRVKAQKAKKEKSKNFFQETGTSKRRIKVRQQRKGIYSKNSPFYNSTIEEVEDEK